MIVAGTMLCWCHQITKHGRMHHLHVRPRASPSPRGHTNARKLTAAHQAVWGVRGSAIL